MNYLKDVQVCKRMFIYITCLPMHEKFPLHGDKTKY